MNLPTCKCQVNVINSPSHLYIDGGSLAQRSLLMSCVAVAVAVESDMEDLQTFKKECLSRHNRLRAEHGAPPLEWSDDCEGEPSHTAC